MFVVYCLKEKSRVFEAFKHYHLQTEKHTSATLKAVQTDNGGKYEGRMNRTLNNTVVSCLLDVNLGDAYWADVVLSAMYNRNQSPLQAILGYIPFTLWNNNYKLSITHLQPFGCTAYAHIPKKVMFIGYNSNHKAWRFYDPKSCKESSSRDATFLEDVPYMLMRENVTFDNANRDQKVQHFDDSDSDSDTNKHIIPITKSPSTSTSTSIPNPSPSHTPSLSPNPSPDPPTLSQKDHTGKQTVKHTNNTWMPCHTLIVQFVLAATDPCLYQEALASLDTKQWEDSIQVEYNSLVKMGTFKIVDLPPGQKAMPSTYMFKEKKGDLQKKGEDFNKVFAPVPCLNTVCAVFSYAASQGWEINQLDFKSAFLNSDLEEEMYMKPPQGFQHDDGKVWKLQKSLYGLQSSPKCWHNKLTKSFTDFQLVRSTTDFSVYIGCHSKDTTILVTHINDMAITGSNMKKENKVKEYIKDN
ncbi:hypothetical protein FRC01_012953 [Tulasnella sp. 417]|nr:hypothetical protein FRC01_012953 [Tulasnella sp. 417]